MTTTDAKPAQFLISIRNRLDHSAGWPEERMGEFLAACERYIGELERAGHLIAAQPLVRTGIAIERRGGELIESPLPTAPDVQVGYYLIRARDTAEAIAIARRNPELEYSDTARVELRPIKTREVETGFTYPTARA